jgi:trehalose 2-sulfotransferase
VNSEPDDGRPRAIARDLENPAPIRNWMGRELDFPDSAPLRKSYVVASSYRCGSTFFCSELWRTGILGAPAEYLNIGEGRMLRDVMAMRLQASSPEDYFVKLLARRTSRNGVFGMKAHFHHFEPALTWCPSMLERLSPVTYIHLDRRDRLAQAVSMARAMQTNAWTSMDGAAAMTPRYDEGLIGQCLEEIGRQRFGWLRWFEINAIAPVFVNFEDLIADPPGVVRGVVELFEVENDEPEQVHPPAARKQGDEINLAWAARFRREHGLPPTASIDGSP